NSPAESAEIMSVLLLSHTCGNDHQYKRDTFRWEVLEMVSSSVCLCVPLHQIFGCLMSAVSAPHQVVRPYSGIPDIVGSDSHFLVWGGRYRQRVGGCSF